MIVGLGVDIVEIQRLRTTFKRHGERFKRRIFTPLEQGYCDSHVDPIPYYAARFAAKEAAFKALGTGWAKGVQWLEVEVQRRVEGAPILALRGEAEKRAGVLGWRISHLTLSHSNDAAVAVVILES